MKHVNLRLPDELHERLRLLADRERRSINSMIAILIERATPQDQPESPLR